MKKNSLISSKEIVPERRNVCQSMASSLLSKVGNGLYSVLDTIAAKIIYVPPKKKEVVK